MTSSQTTGGARGIDRRRFVQGVVGAASLLGARGLLAAPAPRRDDAEPWFRISLAEWSFHNALYAGTLDHLEFASLAKSEFGIEGVEYVSTFFKDHATDFDYLREMNRRAQESGVRSLLIMIDGEGALAAEDDEERRTAVENHFKWIAAARFLGCHSIRVNAAGTGDIEKQSDRAADSLRRLARIGETYGINVIVENHGGISSNGQWLAGVMRKAGNPRVGTLPDFGNFNLGDGREYDRYQGVSELMPFAKAVSAKTHDFDEQGEEIHTNYHRMMKIVKDAGYRGFVGIEYEGSGLPEADGVRATKALLERVRAELA